MCKEFKWKLHNAEYMGDMLLIPLGSCDMVLEVQWLSQLGKIKWDFKRLQMEFTYVGRVHTLRALRGKKVQWVGESKLHKAIMGGTQLYMIQVVEHGLDDADFFSLHNLTSADNEVTSPSITQLLEQYVDLFEEPRALTLNRGVFNHMIPLIPGTTPVLIRPYRYPLKQRDVIESLVQEMLDEGIVQHGSSPFASPVVLVGKKDGS